MDSSGQASAPGKEDYASGMETCFREAYKKTPFRGLVAFAVFSFYKAVVGPFLHSLGSAGMGCRYPQSCSEFGARSILSQGIFKGALMAAYRVCSCNPWMEPRAHLMTAQDKEAS
jgi:putative component of membrane protein insertase Oxa1/YidC/SpoIIIJ protein YidD